MIAVDWADLDDHKEYFLLRAAMVVKGRPITLYQEVHGSSTKEKVAALKRFWARLKAMLGDGSRKQSTMSLKHARSTNDPWLLVTFLPAHARLAKQVVVIYRQRMQIEEGFRDLKSSRFSLGFEQNNSVKPSRLSVLLLLTTLASLAAILLGFAVMAANKHRRFQANTEAKAVLSVHTLGLRALALRMRFTNAQWRCATEMLRRYAQKAAHETLVN